MWEQALPLVKSTISRLIRQRRLTADQATGDLLQEGTLAAGRAVRTWQPDKGAFSTWVVNNAQGALMDHLRRVSNGLVGGRDASGVAGLYDEERGEDHGTFEPAVTRLERDQDAAVVRIAIEGLKSAQDQELVRRYYGIDCEPERLVDIAVKWKLPQSTMERMLRIVLKKLKGVLRDSR